MRRFLLLTVLLAISSVALCQTVYVIKSDVNLRKGPDNTKRILRTVATGEEILLLEKTNEWWWNVEYKGTKGYIASDFIVISYPKSALNYIAAYPVFSGVCGGLLVLIILIYRPKKRDQKSKKKKRAKK